MQTMKNKRPGAKVNAQAVGAKESEEERGVRGQGQGKQPQDTTTKPMRGSTEIKKRSPCWYQRLGRANEQERVDRDRREWHC